MSGVSSSIQLYDRMTPVFQSITSSMSMMLNTFGAVQSACGTAVDSAAFVATQQEITNASVALAEYQEELSRVSRTTVPAPVEVPQAPPPTSVWKSTSAPEVFTNTGVERFTDELQSANQMAQQLYRSQQDIAARARTMSVTPPGMVNDMVSVEDRMQALTGRIQQLNTIPINLQTDQTNNELETLRGKLSQAVTIQNDLNQAMSDMDIGSANAAYLRLNNVINSAEAQIRNNVQSQEEFNETVESGGSSYNGLLAKVMEVAAILGAGFTVENMVTGIYQSAAELEATQAKYTTVFAGMTESSDQFLAEFRSLTPATIAESRSMASGLQDLLVPMGMNREAATKMTGETLHLIGALTNFNSATKTAEDVSDAFASALTGEYDSLKSLGIQVNDSIVKQQAVAMGLAESEKSVSAAARAQALLELATRQSGDALAAYNQESLDTTSRMQIMQGSFTDVFAQAGQMLLPKINDLLIQVQAHMPQITAGIYAFATGFGAVIDAASTVFNVLMDIAGVVSENWSWLGPIITGVVTALVAYNTVLIIGTALEKLAALAKGIHGAAMLLATGETLAYTVAQYGLNAALLACPITWIIIIIIAVIAAIAAWVHKVGGLKIAWLMCMQGILTTIDLLKLAFIIAVAFIDNSLNNMILAFERVKVGVQNALGQMKVGGLTILENFINGAIDLINKLITVVNNIPGISIETIQHVEFAASAAAEEEIKRNDRADGLAERTERNDARKKAWQREADLQEAKTREGVAARNAEIQELQKAQKEEDAAKEAEEGAYIAPAGAQEVATNTGNTAANTAAIADSMNILDEDLKYMRDAAEQEVINRFTLAELKVDMTNNNTLKSEMDIDAVCRQLANTTSDFLTTAAEGAYI